jgi:hypothetical protein
VAHAPPLQKAPCAQSPSAAQSVPQTPLSHAPARHVVGAVHAVPFGLPQLPSALHTFEMHCVARVHAAPFARSATHAPASQDSPDAHCASVVHAAAHAPFTQAPLRHARPAVHVWPFGAPHRLSLKHTPPRHSAAAAQGAPLSAPHVASAATQIDERHAEAPVQLSPLRSPHLSSASHTALRHVVAAVHAVPFGLPHAPSALHTPLRHTAAVLHDRAFGSPHRLSPVSQTPLAHTRAPALLVHTPPSGALAGMPCPLAIFAAHVPAPLAAVGLSHHLPGQSASTVHCGPHAPDPGLQIAPACVAPAHCGFEVHTPHEPSPAQ